MFSQTAEYALRAVVCLAQCGGGPLTTAQIAQRTRVPADYLSKVLQSLSRGGIVSARRGLNGGFTLASDAREISLLQVINSVDPLKRITECPLGLKEHCANLCALHRKLDDAIAYLEQTFANSSIDMMVSGKGPLIPLGPPAAGDTPS